jgi:hypothetical protein
MNIWFPAIGCWRRNCGDAGGSLGRAKLGESLAGRLPAH